MTPPVRASRLITAMTRQAPVILAGVVAVGAGYLAAAAAAGRPITVWDVIASAAAAAVTGLVGVRVAASMARAAQTAVEQTRRAQTPAPDSAATRTGLPVITPAHELAEQAEFPSYDADPEAAIRAMQDRVDRARPRPTWAP